MKESTSKEKVLKRVRNALINKSKDLYTNVDFDSPIHANENDSLEIAFAEKFTALNGNFAFCENHDEFISIISELIVNSNLGNPFCLEAELKSLLNKGNIKFEDNPSNIAKHKIAITFCEFLIARTGSIMISSRQTSGRRTVVYPDTHIVVAYTSQLVDDIKDAIKGIKDRYPDKTPSLMSLITGPSRTADIEKTLILGAHGPKDLYVFLIEG